MNMLKKTFAALGVAAASMIIIAAPAFADLQRCLDNYYPNLITADSGTVEYPVKCPQVKIGNEYVTFYAKTSADCVSVTRLASDLDTCGGQETSYADIEREEITDYYRSCTGKGKQYPNLSIDEDANYPIKCAAIRYNNTNTYITFYAKTSADCASAATIASSRYGCTSVPTAEDVMTFHACTGPGKKYPNISISESSTYPVRCPVVKYKNSLIGFYGKTAEDCNMASQAVVDRENCTTTLANTDDDSKYVLFIYLVIAVVTIFTISIFVLVIKSAARRYNDVVNNTMNNTKDDGVRYFMYPDNDQNDSQNNSQSNSQNPPTQPPVIKI